LKSSRQRRPEHQAGDDSSVNKGHLIYFKIPQTSVMCEEDSPTSTWTWVNLPYLSKGEICDRLSIASNHRVLFSCHILQEVGSANDRACTQNWVPARVTRPYFAGSSSPNSVPGFQPPGLSCSTVVDTRRSFRIIKSWDECRTR
jgi:hypothetical protein